MSLGFGELTPEREEELIEMAAKFIVERGLAEVLTMFYDSGFKYYPGFVAQMGAFYLYPYSPLLGSVGPDLTMLLASNPRENLERIRERVRELEERRIREEIERPARTAKPRRSLLRSLSKRLRSLLQR